MENKKDRKLQENKGKLILQNRSKLQISGVQEVISFNEEEIVLSTELGGLNIKGHDLKMNKLDVNNGEINITGTINSCIYKNGKKSKQKDTILGRIFR